ncbi:MAG: carboxypeptidase-like regulatory domain-containing protein [Bacteroidales bacterium]|nr:carboxypeptidase-like regulatory domain-containing protein [Bacteroidales bacterium]
MKKKLLYSAILTLTASCCLHSTQAEAQTLRGTVCFRDSAVTPAAYSTVYLPDLKSGTTVSSDGTFSIGFDRRKSAGKLRVEFSFIGFETSIKEIDTGNAGDCQIDTVFLERQDLMLPAAYVVPGFRNPADYILQQVSRQAAANRKKFSNYAMDIDYDFRTCGLPTVSGILSGFALGAVKAATGLMGFGPLVRYALENEDLSASVSLSRRMENGKEYDSNLTLNESNPVLPAKVRRNVLDASRHLHLDEFLYSDDCLWGKNKRMQFKFNLVASYQWGDCIVDVLKWTDKKGRLSATVHVVEDSWGILKVEAGYDDKLVRCEARDIGGGYFLPVSFTVTPSFFPMIKAEDIPRYIEKVKTDDRLDKGTRTRLVKVLESQTGKDFHPYVVGSFSVRYR